MAERTQFFATKADMAAGYVGMLDGDVVQQQDNGLIYRLSLTPGRSPILNPNDDLSVLLTAGDGVWTPTAPPLVFFGLTDGSGANQSVELTTPWTASGYLDAAALIAAGAVLAVVHIEVDGGGAAEDVGNANAKIARTLIINKACAYASDPATTVLDSAGSSSGAGDAATNLWTLTLAHAAAGGGKPDRLSLTFATGANNSHKCKVRVEVSLQPITTFPS